MPATTLLPELVKASQLELAHVVLRLESGEPLPLLRRVVLLGAAAEEGRIWRLLDGS